MPRPLWPLASLAFLGALLLGWQLLANTGVLSPIYFPSPARSFGALWQQMVTGELWAPLAETVRRMLLGWALACLLGIALGAAIASSRLARELLEPFAEFLRPLPASAVLPAAILLLGLTDRMILTVIAFGAIWPVLLGTIHGFKAVEPRLIEVARMLRLSPWERLAKIAIPNALPDIFAGVRISLAISLILTVVAEMLSSQPGVGHLILLAARSFRSPELFAGIIVLGALGWLTNLALERAERRLLRWRPQVAGG